MTFAASRAKAAAFHAAAPAPPRMQRRTAERFVPPLASLAAIPTRPLVPRKCGECAREEAEDMPVQARLEVGPVGDRFEQEADAIAGKVMAMRNADVSTAAPSVQRACSACASSEDEPKARRTALVEPEKDDEQVRARHGSDEGGPETIGASHDELTRGGTSLPAATRGFFEDRMGRDLSDVRIHQGGEAQDLNGSIAARAFTYRNHIWLGAGESASASFTMAHELAHVMQQTAPGPVGPGDGSIAAQRDTAAIQRKSPPFFLPAGTAIGESTKALHREMHNASLRAMQKANSDTKMKIEVAIPGATRKIVSTDRCGFADLYVAGNDFVPGVKAIQGKSSISESGAVLSPAIGGSIESFPGASEQSCERKIKDKYPRAPKLVGGKLTNLANAPQEVKIGEVKPAHDEKYRSDGKVQVDNYLAGLTNTIAATNEMAAADKSQLLRWKGVPVALDTAKLPVGWTSEGAVTDGWPIKNLKIRGYDVPTPTARQGKRKNKKAKDIRTGTTQAIRGRWMFAPDDVNKGVFLYFLAPEPKSLYQALSKHSVSKGFKKLAWGIADVQKPLITPPKVDAVRRLPLRTNGGKAAAAPPRVRRKAVDRFDAARWDAKRMGAKAFPADSKDNLLEKYQAAVPESMAEDIAEDAAMLEWIKSKPKTPGISYPPPSNEGDISEDLSLLKKVRFWTGIQATPLGKLRQAFGNLFVKGYTAFEKIRTKIRKVFREKHFKPKDDSSSLGIHAIKILARVFAVLGKKILSRTVSVIGACLRRGFTAYMKAKVSGEVDTMIEKAKEIEASVKALEKDIEKELEAKLEESIGDIRGAIAKIAKIGKVVAAIGGGIAEIVRVARMLFCLSGLSAMGWGAIVTCILSVADWIASKFGKSPLDWIVKSIMSSCTGKRIFARVLLTFSEVRELPRTLAGIILAKIGDVLPEPAKAMICDTNALQIQDLSMADFECSDTETEGEDGSDGGGTSDHGMELDGEDGLPGPMGELGEGEGGDGLPGNDLGDEEEDSGKNGGIPGNLTGEAGEAGGGSIPGEKGNAGDPDKKKPGLGTGGDAGKDGKGGKTGFIGGGGGANKDEGGQDDNRVHSLREGTIKGEMTGTAYSISGIDTSGNYSASKVYWVYLTITATGGRVYGPERIKITISSLTKSSSGMWTLKFTPVTNYVFVSDGYQLGFEVHERTIRWPSK